MTQTLLELEADLNLSLASAVSVGSTTATLSSATNADGDTLITGKYGFTIDGGNSAKEFIVCDLVGTALTNIQSIDLQGTATTGFANYHRIGATVTITDWAILKRILNNLDGTTGFNSATPIKYDAEPSYADPLTIPTVQFVLDEVNGGTVTFNRQIISGDAGENVSAGDWVYYNTTDGEWYLTDADDVAKCLNVQIGKAIGAGTNGLPIDGGIFISGTETVGTYVAGTTYYLSNTAGELATSAGTNSVVVGVGDGNGDLVLRKATPSQVDAMQGSTLLGTPSTTNKFITEDGQVLAGYFSMTAGETINGATLPVPVYQDTTSNKVLACDGNDTTKLKFIGFAVSNSTDTNPVDVKTSGIVGGFTGLDEGVSYWLSDTVGTIQTTPGTNTVYVGIAVSSTQLLIQKGKRYYSANGGSVGTATGSVAVTCGFRPTVVRIFAYSASTSSTASMSAVWTNGAMTAVANIYNEGSTGSVVNLAQLFNDSAGSYMTFSVGSVTNTGFTITWTENGSFSVDGYFTFEAEGEI